MNATFAAHPIFASAIEERPLTIDRPTPKAGAAPKARVLPAAQTRPHVGDHHLRDVVRDMHYFSSWQPRW